MKIIPIETEEDFGKLLESWDTPKIQNVRINRQHGRFLYQLRLDGRLEQIPELTKYEIAASLRPVALKMLQDKGHKHTEDYLFPTFAPTP